MPLSGRSVEACADRIPPKPPPEGRTRRQAPHPGSDSGGAAMPKNGNSPHHPPNRKWGRRIPRQEGFALRSERPASAGKRARAMRPAPHVEAGTAAYASDDDLFIFLRRQRRADVRRNVTKAELRDSIRVGQAKGASAFTRSGKVGIFTADNRFRFAAMRHVVTHAGNAETPHRHQRGCGTSGQPCADLQQIDGLTKANPSLAGFRRKASGVAFKNVGNNAAYISVIFRVIHSILKMWFRRRKPAIQRHYRAIDRGRRS